MGAARTAAVATFSLLVLPQCTTEACGCTPGFIPAVVVGRVLGALDTPMQGARVRAYSSVASGCHSVDTDFGSVTTEPDGSFAIGLNAYDPRDSICVFVFARPPAGASGLTNSDTTLAVMDFSRQETLDTARVELVLHTLP